MLTQQASPVAAQGKITREVWVTTKTRHLKSTRGEGYNGEPTSQPAEPAR